MNKLNLATLAVNTRNVQFEMPGCNGFKVNLTYQSRRTYEKLRDSSMVQKFDDQGYPYKDLDKDLYIKNYAKSIFKDWSNLTYGTLASLVLIDEDQVEDMDALIEFDVDTAVFLLENSERFDSWVTKTVSKLDNFRNKKA